MERSFSLYWKFLNRNTRIMSSFIHIPGGSYKIGIERDILDTLNPSLVSGKIKSMYLQASSPAQEVHVKDFMISEKLVTYDEFREFIESSSYVTESESEGWGWIWENGWRKREGVSWKNPFMTELDTKYRAGNFPVMQVSWNDAVKYTEWLTGVKKCIFTLPYEVEWEIFAVQCGIKSMMDGGIQSPISVFNSGDFLNGLVSSDRFQTGLLWEWTLDWYEGYSGNNGNRDFGHIYKVLRGGSLLSDNIQRSSDFRFRRCPTARSPFYGIRIVKRI